MGGICKTLRINAFDNDGTDESISTKIQEQVAESGNKDGNESKVNDNNNTGTRIVVKQEMEWLVYGACFLASGGGGPLQLGLEFVNQIDGNVALIKPQSIEDNNSSICTCALGSPEAVSNSETLGRTAPLNCTKYMIQYAKNQYNSTLSSVYPIEIGAVNTIIPFFVASKLNLDVMDVDVAGRSVPYIHNTLLAVNDVPCCPACVGKDDDVAEQGEAVVFSDTKLKTEQFNEEIVKQMVEKWNVKVSGLNIWLILEPSSPSFCNIVNTFTIDICIELGRLFMSNLSIPKKTEQLKQILATKNKTMYNLFVGKLTSFETMKDGVIDLNRAVFTNTEKEQIAIYGLNENLIAYNLTHKKLQAMAPDGITFVDNNNYYPHEITSVKKYLNKDVSFSLFGIEAWDNLLKSNFVDAMLKTVEDLSVAVRKMYPNDQLSLINEYIPINKLQEKPCK